VSLSGHKPGVLESDGSPPFRVGRGRGLAEGAPFNPSVNWHREPALAKSTSLAH